MSEAISAELDVGSSLGAKHALGILLAFIVVMIVADNAAALLINNFFDNDFRDVSENDELVGAFIALRQFASLTGAALFLFLYLRFAFPKTLQREIYTRVGLNRTTRRWVIFSALFGFLFSLILARVIGPFFPPDADFTPNPLQAKTQTGNWVQYLTALMVVVMSPVTEEMLFRGILYEGFSTAWGKIVAAILMSLLFIIFHNETLAGGYWLSITSLIVISISFLISRELSGSIFPPMLIHSGFNLALVLPI